MHCRAGPSVRVIGKLTKNFYHEFEAERAGKLVEAFDRVVLSVPALEEEGGYLRFVVANLARHLKVDPEVALRGANAKFTRRFGAIEAALARAGRRPEEASLAEMDALWDVAKRAEKNA